MENFFGLIKTELSYLHEWASAVEFEKEHAPTQGFALEPYIH